MLLNDICKFIENKISVKYALASDKIGFADEYDLNLEINSVKVKVIDGILFHDINCKICIYYAYIRLLPVRVENLPHKEVSKPDL